MQNYYSIPHLVGLRLSGPDAIAFCQSQFCADIEACSSECWQTTAWCDPKGRVRAVIITARYQDRVDLILPRSQATLVETLKPYAIGRKLGFSGLLAVAGSLTPGPNDPWLGDAPRRALMLADPGSPIASPTPAWLSSWRLADLCLPLPWLSPATGGRFLPQFLGLEELGGLSFRKGCYPGQEVIARLHFLGQAKYRLDGFVANPNDWAVEPPPGERILRADGSLAGELLGSVRIQDRLLGLMVSSREVEDGEALTIAVADGLIPAHVTNPNALCYYQNQCEQSN